jgi:hypothetical protein
LNRSTDLPSSSIVRRIAATLTIILLVPIFSKVSRLSPGRLPGFTEVVIRDAVLQEFGGSGSGANEVDGT